MAVEPASTFDESVVVERLRQGDRLSAELVMRQHNRALWRIARGILHDDADAEEAVQEAYLRAFTRIGDFRGEASLGTWLGRIAVNEPCTRSPMARAGGWSRAKRRVAQVFRRAQPVALAHPLECGLQRLFVGDAHCHPPVATDVTRAAHVWKLQRYFTLVVGELDSQFAFTVVIRHHREELVVADLEDGKAPWRVFVR